MKPIPCSNDRGEFRKRKTARWFVLAIVVAGVALTVGEWLRPADRPEGAASSGRQPGPPGTAPARPWQPFETVEQGLELDDANRDSYQVAFDRNRQLDESALTMWLQRVARMPRLSKEQFRDLLDSPSYKNIMRNPRRYKGQAITVDAYALQVRKWMPNEDFTATRWWNIHAGPLWQVDCLHADAQYPAEAPIFVICTFDPKGVLGKPKSVGERGELIYPRNRLYRVAGVFYKLYQVRARDGRMRDYPVLLVWQMGRIGGPGAPWGGSWHMLVIGIVLILAFAFIYLKRRARLARQSGRRWPQYRPLRGEHAEAQPATETARGARVQPPVDGDSDIDPQLLAAAQQHHKERGADDAPDHNGPTR